ncbi:MBL fold metallo-hydrolase [Anaerococcus porci]|uniref:MBL fold metallo-hydrolase n=1 Tax=Anaerococcus porci TaxID=2652269 RepID=UPI002A7565E1|nr:MBL fold metallo-hydrolase [Anaerococcus porci]MDY3005686.1 MBL fold metallo-hydrolase [Anaerococcus porci]
MTQLKKEIIKLADNEYCIRDYNLDNYYLIVGDKKSALIDTGSGIGDPRLEIREITDKDILVLLTHGHLDHAGNAYYFDDIYMNERDDELLDEHFGNPDMIKWFIETRGPVRFPKGDIEELKSYVNENMPDKFKYKNVSEGDKFELGTTVLTTIEIPGHTKGSVGYLSSSTKYLYAGDALNQGIIIPCKSKEKGTTKKEIETMRSSLENLMNYYEDIDKICMGHDGPFKDKSIIKDYLSLCKDLLSGKIKGQYESQEIREGYVVRRGLAEFWYEAYR